MNIAVIGLGKIGLPLAVQYASSGPRVYGVDINAEVVASVNSSQEPFPGETDLQDRLTQVVSAGRLSATTDSPDAVGRCEVVVVVVPLYVDKNATPDFGWMDAATSAIASGLQPGTLVIYETTLPVGTTRQRWKPMLESGSGLREGRDFHVAFSPERVLTGRVFADLRKYPKLVGALSSDGAARAIAFYEQVLSFDERPDLERANGVWDLGSAEAAELAKLAETTYRDVNIGLANQFAIFAAENDIDVYQVIEACNSQPFSHIHQPGISVGGHCIPVYPRLYLWKDPGATVVKAARAANAAMPLYAVELLSTALGGGLAQKKIVVLGATYRGGVQETAFSGVFDLVAALTEAGAHVSVHDPMYDDAELLSRGWRPHSLGTPVDGVILHTDHEEYRSLSIEAFPGALAIVDGRNILDRARFPGATYLVIGDGSRT